MIVARPGPAISFPPPSSGIPQVARGSVLTPRAPIALTLGVAAGLALTAMPATAVLDVESRGPTLNAGGRFVVMR